VRSEVNLAHIIFLKDSIVAKVWSVVSSHVVDAASSGKRNSRLELICLDQPSISILNVIANIHELTTWLDNCLGIFPDLPVHFCCPSQSIIVHGEHSFFISEFCISNSPSILISVLADLSQRIRPLLELLRHWNCRNFCLFPFSRLP
jgi:hypothetical protein